MEDNSFIIPSSYANLDLSETFKNELFKTVQLAYAKGTVFPLKENLFRALKATPKDKVKVVILGQDPYPTKGFAMGLAFGVDKGCKIPKSLKNIIKELNDDLNLSIDDSIGHSLYGWALQGVLLLNTILTVEEGKPLSHEDFGWQKFTDAIIKSLNENVSPIVFILWGKNAQEKLLLIDQSKHFVIMSPHPSPLSCRRGFFKSKPFSKTNEILISKEITPIDWEKID